MNGAVNGTVSETIRLFLPAVIEASFRSLPFVSNLSFTLPGGNKVFFKRCCCEVWFQRLGLDSSVGTRTVFCLLIEHWDPAGLSANVRNCLGCIRKCRRPTKMNLVSVIS